MYETFLYALRAVLPILLMIAVGDDGGDAVSRGGLCVAGGGIFGRHGAGNRRRRSAGRSAGGLDQRGIHGDHLRNCVCVANHWRTVKKRSIAPFFYLTNI